MRSVLGIMPPAAGVSQYPSLYFAPISAGAAFAFDAIHKDVHSKKKKRKKKKKKS